MVLLRHVLEIGSTRYPGRGVKVDQGLGADDTIGNQSPMLLKTHNLPFQFWVKSGKKDRTRSLVHRSGFAFLG